MSVNPYESPNSTNAIAARSYGLSLEKGIKFGLGACLLSVAAMVFVGSGLWLLIALLSGNRREPFTSWWFENAHFFLVPLPFAIGFTSFVYGVNIRRFRFDFAFVIMVLSGFVFYILLEFTPFRSIRYRKGPDPLFYPTELWGYVVPFSLATLGIISYYLYSTAYCSKPLDRQDDLSELDMDDSTDRK